MPYYRLYHIQQSRFSGVNGFHANDDAAAIVAAKGMNGTATSELWEGGRKIITFQPDDKDYPPLS